MHEGTDPGDVLRPFLTVLDGRVVPTVTWFQQGEGSPPALVAHGWPVVLSGENQWAGV